MQPSAAPSLRPIGAARLRGVPLVVLAMVALAWLAAVAAHATGAASLVHHDSLIEHGPAPWIALPVFLVAWQLMIAAMMLPSSLPLVRIFATASARQPRPHAALAGLLSGYALVWSAFGALAFAADLVVHAAVHESVWLQQHQWLIGGSVLAVAGAFQFAPLKEACLRQCRHPGAFLLRYYKRGAGGALRLGARHGVFCVGCCWALMLIMFATGVANLLWMACLTALMVHEKTRPLGARAVPVTGLALLGAASVVLLYSATAGA